ncbi:uroporphyrinogen-III synthase [Methanolobus zinderi]|uniref:Uroporphyrinogen-III synthase n=1 Tax=Methanolobus zinderi TaxID=536044 RepID=A0A7D5I5N5_9EURY|nr:uroporphyrinogen-III synthase [Methanolobus zinderi]QLC50463.1 uroporphyrinogen-III synthase [Methanolobus zinderi]
MTDNNGKPVIAIMEADVNLPGSVKFAESMGFEPLPIPMVEENNVKDGGFDNFFTHVMKKESDYVIICGVSAIDFILRKLPYSLKEQFVEALSRLNVIASDPDTKKSLEAAAVRVEGMPSHYSAEGLVDYLRDNTEGAVVDIARVYSCSSTLVDGLENFGATVYETIVYNYIDPDGEAQKELIEKSVEGGIDVFAFTNCTMVNNFLDHAKRLGHEKAIVEILNNSVVAVMGDATAQTLRLNRVRGGVEPDNFTFEETLEVSMQAYNDSKINS